MQSEATIIDVQREPHEDDWRPHPGPQTRFLRLVCFEALYGGAAGGGKSDALLVDAIRYVGRGYGTHYNALLLRRTFPELETSLIRRSRELYPILGGRYNEQKKTWTFPEGETVMFGHLETEADVYRYQGSAFQFVGFDELTTFSEFVYLYLFSRVRSAHGVPCRIRAATNPGGIGHAWVRRRFFDFVSRKSKQPAAAGEVRWYVRENDVEREVAHDYPGASSRTFIPARLSDNPALMQNDPGYASRLAALPRLERERLAGGDWDVEPAKKDYWDSAKCGVLRARLPNADVKSRARAWDFGATASPDADATCGVLQAHARSGRIAIEHVVHGRWAPDGIDKVLEATASADYLADPRTIQVIPQDPGAAGKMVAAAVQRLLAKYPIKILRPTGDKVTRFRTISGRQLAGFVDIVDDGTWDVIAYHAEAESFPNGKHDDLEDATSDGYAVCAATEFGGAVPPPPVINSRFANREQHEEFDPARPFARPSRSFGG